MLVIQNLLYLALDASRVVMDIRCLPQALQGYKVSKINRAGNVVAHHLARMFRQGVSAGVLVGSAPPCMVSMIDRDCNECYSSS